VIDLHSHTNESDGTFTPLELVELAGERGVEALAISDHDTFAGFDQALPEARKRGLDLVCGIELSTRVQGVKSQSVHMLAYFLHQSPTEDFRAWLDELLEGRRDRNRRLVASLRDRGVDIELAEVEKLGRTLTGRPHFARILIDKGYATGFDDAFRSYLGETAPTYVERFAPYVPAACRCSRIRFVWGFVTRKPRKPSSANYEMPDCAASRCFTPIIVPPTCSVTPESRANTVCL
jgi:hypothetical protein